MSFTNKDVMTLRQETSCGMMDCKGALTEADGDFEKARELLREKGLASAAKKAGRIASEGLVVSYIHGGGRIGVLLEVNSETDFVAKNADFKEFCNDVAMHIAAMNPSYLDRGEVPEEVIAKEKEILSAQVKAEGKPEAIIEKIVTGKIEKFYKENCLLEQAFIKNDEMTIKDLVAEKVGTIGENINIRRFVRFECGEGLEKRSDDLASEVASML